VQQTNGQHSKAAAQNSYLYNVFSEKDQAHQIERIDSLKNWKSLYEIARTPYAEQQQPNIADLEQQPQQPTFTSQSSLYNDDESHTTSNNMLLIHGDLLATTVRSGLMLIHIRRAQERIWYERLLRDWNTQEASCQRLLFPIIYELPPNDAILLNEILPSLARIGFDISPFGNNTFAVHGLPAGMPAGEEKNVIDEVVEHLKNESDGGLDRRNDLLLIHMARRLSRNKHAIQQTEGQQTLVDELFACGQPDYTPDGKKVFVMVRKELLDDMLG
jgi:DNA mismatch repair protein MutL